MVWLDFTTSCRRTFERNLRSLFGCTSLACSCFTRFHQDLGWLSCLRSPTSRHAVDHFVIRVSLDISASFWSSLILLSSVLLSTHRMRALVTGISNPMTALRRFLLLLVHVDEQGILSSMYAQVREEEQVISLQFVGSQQDQIAGKRSGSKPMMLLLSHSCPHCIGP